MFAGPAPVGDQLTMCLGNHCGLHPAPASVGWRQHCHTCRPEQMATARVSCHALHISTFVYHLHAMLLNIEIDTLDSSDH